MIENEKQYRVTKKRITQFEESLASLLTSISRPTSYDHVFILPCERVSSPAIG